MSSDLCFSVVSVLLSVNQDQLGSNPALELEMKYAGHNKLISADGQILNDAEWGLFIEPLEHDDKLPYVGLLFPVRGNYSSAHVSISQYNFDLMVKAAINGKFPESVYLKLDSLVGADAGILLPNSDQISIKGIKFSVNLLSPPEEDDEEDES